MDPNPIILDISSDEEQQELSSSNWTHPTTTIIDDDYNWISDILDEVNRDNNNNNNNNCRYDDDSDDVVVVSESLPKKPRRKLAPKAASFVEFDDDCMVLEHDPDKVVNKAVEAQKENSSNLNGKDLSGGDDSDDVVVVGESGQVACRDYPHPRHLCIKFPFSSTPNQTHCDQCYCYVCDSLAPCIYWGDGSGPNDHCLATEKISYWKLERQNSKKESKEVSVLKAADANPVIQTPAIDHCQNVRLNPTRALPVTPSFVVPNTINQDRSAILSARSKFQPGLVSHQLTRTSSCTLPGSRSHNDFSLSNLVQRPPFKRTASDSFAPTTSRYSSSSYYRGSYRNQFTDSLQPNAANTPVPVYPNPNTTFDFAPSLQPVVNSDPYVDVPVLFQPNPVLLSSQAQGKSSLQNCTFSSEASRQERQRSTVDPKFFSGISWPQSQINHQPAAESSLHEGVRSTNEPSLASASRGLVDYEYDNWMFSNQPGCVDGSGPFDLREISPDPTYLDSGTLFDF